jgi:hypothetical protein
VLHFVLYVHILLTTKIQHLSPIPIKSMLLSIHSLYMARLIFLPVFTCILSWLYHALNMVSTNVDTAAEKEWRISEQLLTGYDWPYGLSKAINFSTAVTVKIAAWIVALCCLVDQCWCSLGTCCLVDQCWCCAVRWSLSSHSSVFAAKCPYKRFLTLCVISK